MGAGQPAIAIKLVMIETKLADELRMLGTAAFQSGADVQNNDSIVPICEICEAIFDVKIMQVATCDLFAFFGAHGADDGILSLPPCNFFRVLNVGEINHSH